VCANHYMYMILCMHTMYTDAEVDRTVALEEVVCMLQCLDTQDWDGSVASVQHAIAALSQWIPATSTTTDATADDMEQVRLER
jgi:hypothetical protein